MTYAFNNVLSISNTTIVFVNVYSHNVFKVLRELSYVLSLVQKRHNLCRKFQDGVYPCNNSSIRRKDVTPGTFWFLVSLECLMGILHFFNLSLTSAIFRRLLCRHSFWVTSIWVTMSLYCLFYFVIVIPYRPNPRRREKNELNFYEGLHKTF